MARVTSLIPAEGLNPNQQVRELVLILCEESPEAYAATKVASRCTFENNNACRDVNQRTLAFLLWYPANTLQREGSQTHGRIGSQYLPQISLALNRIAGSLIVNSCGAAHFGPARHFTDGFRFRACCNWACAPGYCGSNRIVSSNSACAASNRPNASSTYPK
jgi:hypothetical protein